MASDARAARRRATPKAPAPAAPAPGAVDEEAGRPPAVTVVLNETDGKLTVGDVGAVGLTVDQYQFWLEEGIKFVRKATGKQ